MKEQRLVNTFLTGGAEEDESPRVRNLPLYVPAFSGVRRDSLNNAYKMKALKCRIKSLRDNKLADIVLGLFSPIRFGITEYFGYDITILKDHIRFLEVIVNRNGEMGGILPLWFDGAVCDFKELPKADDTASLQKWYNYCKNLKNPQQKATHAMFMPIVKQLKKLISTNSNNK